MSLAGLDRIDAPCRVSAREGLQQHYLGFISYRRRDGALAANWLRQRIGTFRPPHELRDAIEGIDASVGGPSNRVFLDKSYQRSHANFWDDHIGPSVRRSRNLLLLLTPSVFEKLPGGEPNWVDREIETFLASGQSSDRILLILGPGAPDDRVPEALARVSSLWDWADLRFFNPSAYHQWRKAIDYEAQLTKVLARLFDISDGDLPALTREFERARQRVQRRIYAMGAATILGLAGLATWASIERARAVVAEAAALQQRDEAIRQKNAALVAQSLYLTRTAVAFREQGSARQAVKLLLPALPDAKHGNERPLVAETVAQSYVTLHGDHEVDRILLPKDARSAAISRDGALLAAIEPTGVTLLDLPRGSLRARLPLNIGVPRHAKLSPDLKTLVVELADGAIQIIDLMRGEIVAHHGGLGPGTDIHFVAGAQRLLLQSASRSRLALVDLATGASIERSFEQARVAAIAADGQAIVIVADSAIRRLAIDTLLDVTTHGITPRPYMVSAIDVSDGSTLFAYGKDFLQGAVIVLDPDLHEVTTFPLTLGDVSGLSVSPDGSTIAVHSPPNLAFYDRKTGAAIARETSLSTSGRFYGKGEFQQYVVSAEGAVAVFTPRHGLKTVYMGEDETDITDVVVNAAGDAFTTVTSAPLVTLWSIYSASIGHQLALPRDIRDTHFTNFPLVTGVTTHDHTRLVNFYLDGSIGIWDPVKGALLRTFDRLGRPDVQQPLLMSPDDQSIIGWTSDGRFFRQSLNSSRISWFRAGKSLPRHPFFLDASHLALETAEDGLLIQDLDNPAVPPTRAGDRATCAAESQKDDLRACSRDGRLFVTNLHTGHKLWNDERGDHGTEDRSVMAFSDKKDLLALVDGRGMLQLLSARTGRQLWEKQLFCEIEGPMLLRAADSPLLDEEARKAIRSGATHVTVKLFANTMAISPDEKVLALSFPNRTVQLVALNSHEVVANLSFDATPVQLAFSKHGSQLAILARGDDASSSELRVYDISLVRTVLSKMMPISDLASVFAVGDGEGFGVLSPPYRGGDIYPVWEDPSRLVDFMSTKYPGRLTASQRHQFHID